MDLSRRVCSFLVSFFFWQNSEISQDSRIRLLLFYGKKMNVLSVRKMKRRNNVRREKTVEDNDSYSRSKNVNMKIRVQMKDDMPSAINETTPC